MMQPRRLRLTELQITDGELPPASVRFTPGLNLVVGASDTGKTFIFEAIVFMLGARDGLRRIPEANGYNHVFLSIDPTVGPEFTLRRAFGGGQFVVSEFGDGRDAHPTQIKKLSEKHGPDPDTSLSSYLLRPIGLAGREVRKNDKGEKTALSFRDVAHLTLISETDIIEQGSPILTGQYTQKTREQNVFAFFLTNQDDSHILAYEGRKERNARLDIEASTIEEILADRRKELDALTVDPAQIADQAARLEAAIGEATQAVITAQDEIAAIERRRAEIVEQRTQATSRLRFLVGQLSRLRLLDLYYKTDRDRLRAVVEASKVYHELPEGTCPLCDQPYSAADRNGTPHRQFEASCIKEIQKIDVLQADLREAIADFNREEAELRDTVQQLGLDQQRIQGRWLNVLSPKMQSAQTDLQSLIDKRMTLAQGETLRATARSLEERLARIEVERSQKVVRSSFEPRATTSVASEFCEVVEEILRAWKYPNLGAVSYDTEKDDLVINGQDRANKGKGYRAITYAAFAIGVMKYCRRKDIPHPGFVIIDTPMNPFKGPDAANTGERVTQDVKAAFYEYLANETSGDQIIVLENEEPPDAVRNRVSYYHFSGNPAVDRCGFFPVRADQSPELEAGHA